MSTQPPGVVCTTEKMEVTPAMARANFAGVAVVLFILVFAINPAGLPSDLGRFLSRFHPSLVHFPIALLALAIGLDLVARLGRCTTDWARWIYVAGSWAGLVAVAAGLWLAQAGGYPQDTINLHKLAGLLITLLSAGIPWIQSASWKRDRDAPAIGAAVVLGALLVFGGHEGGTLTHGPGYLTAHAPDFVRTALGIGDAPSRLALGDPDTTTVYHGIVQPILQDRCTACHGQDRTRGGLDLRTPDAIMEGSQDGPVIVPGRPESSSLLARIHLPEDHRRKMPPEDAAPLSPSDAALLSWWVAEGASFDLTLATAAMPPRVRAILEAHGLGEIRTGVWALDIPAPNHADVAALTALGARVRPVAQDEVLLQVRCETRAACFGDGGSALAALAPQVVWLDLSRSDVTDADLALISALQHLEKLWLQKTAVRLLEGVEELAYLAYLNVSETQVTADALRHVSHVDDVYTWGSPAAETGQ